MRFNGLSFRIFLSLATFLIVQEAKAVDTLWVPLGGNSFLTRQASEGTERVSDSGWLNWEHPQAVFSAYFYVSRKGEFSVSANNIRASGKAVIACSFNGSPREINILPGDTQVFLGKWMAKEPGYVKLDFRGVSRAGATFPVFSKLACYGAAIDSLAACVRDNRDHFFYWGRRGPSVHLNYELPAGADSIEWFYSEIEVPEGHDVIGSYFMADGFAQGYFGMQVNSETERRILFSVWSPYQTDDPSSIPDDQRVKLLDKGDRVQTGEFGNEGAGGQSFLRFPWKSGKAYGFLLRAVPEEDSCTEYSAWFYVPDSAKWLFIARFKRPHTHTWLTRLHSFLENFIPETGWLSRKARYQNQLLRSANGGWRAIEAARFSYDATARKRYRLDYYAKGIGKGLVLQNDGFFFHPTLYGTRLPVRPVRKAPPALPPGMEKQ